MNNIDVCFPLGESPIIGIWRRLLVMLTVAFTDRETARGLEDTGSLSSRFDSLLREHGPLISRICFSYAVDGDDYQDLRQDVLLNIWKGLANFRGDSSSVTWVYRVALNTCVSTVRKRSARPYMERLDTMPLDFPAERDDDDMRERMEMLHMMISELTPVDKAIMTMWLDERSYEEIAEVTGVSKNNVGLRLHRIRDRWKKRS
ncbi:MAG: sigma-70 family RNA polymerase sigma factor [Bacteroides sp.]|nr:sigma-70 family RNA polymerase sigma factor [Bacteroides sp.]